MAKKKKKKERETRGGKMKDPLSPFEKQFSKTCLWSKKRTKSKDSMKKEQDFNSVTWKASTPAI